MVDPRESQHALLHEEDLSSRPHGSWPGPSSPPEYSSAPNSRQHSFADNVFHKVGLGISNTHNSIPHRSQGSVSSSYSFPDTPGFLKDPAPTAGTVHSPTSCPTRSTLLQRRFGWVHVAIFVLALYATLSSGLYAAVAFWKPRWEFIGTDRKLDSSTATMLCAFVAKTIELSYVTISVAFLGQVLSRRALKEGSRGVSISDMSMRAWIMQPGSMIVHWETVRYSGLTFLGAIALVATLVVMLYTTASETLVSPELKMSPLETKVVWGKVSAMFANKDYLGQHCDIPVTNSMDPDRDNTCLQIDYVGTAYHNYKQWISFWAKHVANGKDLSSKLGSRPAPSGSIWDNTTVTGSWIEMQDITELSKKYNRMVNNITMAMPHGGVPAAAMDATNGIRQPLKDSGEGTHNLEASVPSPAVNVLCVGATRAELLPLIYKEWPDTHFNATTYSSSENIPKAPSWLNRTVLDPIFEWGPKYGQRPPVFPKLPEAYNTVVNGTGIYGKNSVYLLGKPNVTSPEYVICGIRAKQTGVCSTRYNAASSGASLSSHCEDKANTLQYNREDPDFVEGSWVPDWVYIGTEWLNALSLGAGISNGAAANARQLTQMMPAYDQSAKTYSLDPALPSIGEALAVMAGSTLILSSRNAPYIGYWNYSTPALDEPAWQHFKASLQVIGWQSGGKEKWQAVFYVILLFAFVTSTVCLGFFILEARGRQITDFTEPQNLFALAVNSPQSDQLKDACGCGPEDQQLKERWFIGMDEDDAHYYIRAKTDGASPYQRSPYPTSMSTATEYARLRPEPMEMEEGGKPSSPAVDEFRRVSKRGSFFTKFY